MFKTNLKKIENISKIFVDTIPELDNIFIGNTAVYIDYANIIPREKKLKWEIDCKRLYQFLSSFSQIQTVNFYYGTLIGDQISESKIKEKAKIGYRVRTKPVKIISISVDTTSISNDSTDLLKNFIKKSLIEKLTIENIIYLNKRLEELNAQSIKSLEDRKCNFDVEISTDMSIDCKLNGINTFILWSGDSDFHDTVKSLIEDGKKVYIFSTAGKVSHELKNSGAIIYDIKKIKEFICKNKYIIDLLPLLTEN